MKLNNEHILLKVSPAELAVASWIPLHSVHVSQPIAQTSLVLGEWMHTPSTGRPICTIICVTINHFIRLPKTIYNTKHTLNKVTPSVWRLCLSNMASYTEVLKIICIKAMAYLSIWDVSNFISTKILKYISDWNWY